MLDAIKDTNGLLLHTHGLHHVTHRTPPDWDGWHPKNKIQYLAWFTIHMLLLILLYKCKSSTNFEDHPNAEGYRLDLAPSKPTLPPTVQYSTCTTYITSTFVMVL
ncbi:hypothetical protein Pmani_009489 [Petrolisthes manimaculis]|uniref:Uncharacterized protein n=1 Tax=Petrolisthes manimaculis TaxID=1843537 RepID=A0AAE1Q3F5_9EUCA|nr:hypothetical protein Pmani_009489 [Petrolisthes manimaculis]